MSLNKQTAVDFWNTSLVFKRDVFLAAFIPVSTLMNSTLVPLFVGKTLAELGHRNGQPMHYVMYVILAALAGVITNHIGFKNFFGLQPKVMEVLDNKALDSLLKRSVGFHNNNISGKLVTDAMAYSSAFQQLSASFIMDILPFALSIVIGIGIITANSWQLGSLVFLMTASVLYVAIRQTIASTPYRIERHEARRAMIAHMSDTIINNQTVKTFAAESQELTAHNRLSNKLKGYRIRDWQRLATDGSKRIGVLLAFEILFILVIIHLIQKNPALLGIGIFTFSYALNLGNRLFEIGTTFRNVEDAFLEAGDITKLIHQSPEVVDAPLAKKLRVQSGEIIFDAVGFQYQDGGSNDEVFEGLTLHIKAGERIGLVGPSGGGKSTLTRLLLRLEDIQIGSITIDDQDIAHVTQHSLRQSISYVPQEPLLFHRAVTENIAYGSQHLSEEDIINAAKKAYAHEFIAALPNGYNTVVGERGVKLSGGQRQRIAIARAILKNAPLLVLDEATSALDSESEGYIQSALWELMKDRTALVIAHRLSTIQRLDRIIVLVDGKIAEDGSHKELLARDGTYAKLWAHQSGGFIED